MKKASLKNRQRRKGPAPNAANAPPRPLFGIGHGSVTFIRYRPSTPMAWRPASRSQSVPRHLWPTASKSTAAPLVDCTRHRFPPASRQQLPLAPPQHHKRKRHRPISAHGGSPERTFHGIPLCPWGGEGSMYQAVWGHRRMSHGGRIIAGRRKRPGRLFCFAFQWMQRRRRFRIPRLLRAQASPSSPASTRRCGRRARPLRRTVDAAARAASQKA